ncbi:hypothetical protein [Sphingomonas hengshuiensis]|uniref:Uncharacterized protein n=1 Tax=Sphingomonas hengshuiensis TaxID=1609977 RepID=A0A7U4LEF2_9SPHN|nr:hypothetical protein [Sphingomonas hengshuiensis]AJP71424.1 hypothetical protein TS85_06010 [Sphingomonas hengshuiensis]
MGILCSVLGHVPVATRHQNQGLEFSVCHHCGRDLIHSIGDGDWVAVPAGFHVVWREFGRAGDAASVAERMATIAPPPVRRRDPRSGRPLPRRDPRGRPIKGVTTMVGTLASLARLIGSEDQPDISVVETGDQGVICLPGAGGN